MHRNIPISELFERIKNGTLAYFPREMGTMIPEKSFLLTQELSKRIQGKLIDVSLQDSAPHSNIEGNYRLNANAYEAYKKLRKFILDKYRIRIIISGAYRTFQIQESLFDYMHSKPENINKTYEEMCKLVAPPGASEHQSGLAIDLSLIDCNGNIIDSNIELYNHELDFMKIASELENFGFILRYPKDIISKKITTYDFEPWHISFVGRDVAQDMAKNECITLEEYLQPNKYNAERNRTSQIVDNWRNIYNRMLDGLNTGVYLASRKTEVASSFEER